MPEKPKTMPKDFFLWAGAMITLYSSIFAFLALVFSYLNYVFPDPLSYYSSDPYTGGIAYEMATLVVLFPLFLVLMLAIERGIRRDATRGEIWVRRWALYLTLFVAAATIAGDLITLVMYFLQGDVTLRFLLKVLVVFLVALGGFLHFLADLKGYWIANPGKCRALAWATGALVAVTIIAGFFIVGTPWQARAYRYDEQRVNDLQNIQYQVVSYWQAKQALPASLADLGDSIGGYRVPVDPQTGAAYEYRIQVVQDAPLTSFELCATFNTSRPNAVQTPAVRYPAPVAGAQDESWQHGAGRFCFERTIDPSRYPPLNKAVPTP